MKSLLLRLPEFIMFLIFSCNYSSAMEKPGVLFGGFMLSGKATNITANYPYTSQLIYETVKMTNNSISIKKDKQGLMILRDKGSPEFYRRWYDFHKKNAGLSSDIKLITDKNYETATFTHLVAGLVLTGENVRVATTALIKAKGKGLEYRHMVWVYLSFNYIIMDMEEKTIRYSDPIFYSRLWILARKEKPTSHDLLNYVKKTYFAEDEEMTPELKASLKKSGVKELKALGESKSSSLRGYLTERMKNITVKPVGFCSLQVANIKVGKKTIAALHALANNGVDTLKDYLAHGFSDQIAQGLNVCVLPYAKSAAMGKMMLTLPDRTSRSLDIPQSMFAIDLLYPGFIVIPKDETRVESKFLLGAYMKVKVYGRDNGEIFFQNKAKLGKEMVIMKSLKETWDFTADHIKMTKMIDRKIIKKMKSDSKVMKGVIEPCKR